MRVAVFGVGGVGGYFGGRLAQAGLEVTFIARGAHLAAIRETGLQVDSVKGDFSIAPARVEGDPAIVGPVDVVLLGVKAGQVAEAAEAVRPLVGAETVVIPLENGVEASDELSAVLGAEHVAGGLCRISSMIAGPGKIKHVAMEPYIAFNWFDNHADPRLDALRDAFISAGVNVEIPADISMALWAKFAFIAATSGLGSVTRSPIGVYRAIPETRKMLEAAVYEIAAVGRARGVALSPTLEQDTIRFIDNMPPATTTSMQRDIVDGKPSELDFQNGSVVRLGQSCGIPTPVNAFIYATLLPQEKKARGEL